MINLNRMRILIAYKQRLQFDRLKVLAKATKITASITGMPHGGGTGKQIEDGAIELAEIEAAYHEIIEELHRMQTELADIVTSLEDPDDIAVIRLRYLYCKRLQDIPDAIHLSERAMYYHLSGAERKLSRMFPDKVRLQ